MHPTAGRSSLQRQTYNALRSVHVAHSFRITTSANMYIDIQRRTCSSSQCNDLCLLTGLRRDPDERAGGGETVTGWHTRDS